MTHQSKITYLKLASITLIGFGLLTFLSLFTPVQHLMMWFLDIALWSPFGTQHQVQNEVALLFIAITAGISVGMGVILYLIAEKIYTNDPKTGSLIIAGGTISWFVTDGIGSIIAGASMNVVLNAGLLALFIVPLYWPQTALSEAHKGLSN